MCKKSKEESTEHIYSVYDICLQGDVFVKLWKSITYFSMERWFIPLTFYIYDKDNFPYCSFVMNIHSCARLVIAWLGGGLYSNLNCLQNSFPFVIWLQLLPLILCIPNELGIALYIMSLKYNTGYELLGIQPLN